MHRASALALSATAIIVLAACTAAPADSGSAAAPGESPAAAASVASSPAPTASAAASEAASPSEPPASASSGTASGSDCSALASPEAGGVTPMTEYPDLLAMIPADLGGQATHSRQSFRVVEYLCLAGGQGVVDEVVAAAPDGFDFTALQYGGASVNLGEPTSGVAAFRAPGTDASFLVEQFAQIIPLVGGSTETAEGSGVEDTLGGKSVVVWSAPESRSAFLYAKDDVLFVITPKDAAVAETILAALP